MAEPRDPAVDPDVELDGDEDLAGGLRNLVYALAPERIVVGGGVSGLPGLFPALRLRLVRALAGYPRLAEHEAMPSGKLAKLAGEFVSELLAPIA
jgi:fructokinase